MKLRTVLMCIMLSLLSVSAYAGTISGTVTDANSQPLAGITAWLFNSSDGSMTLNTATTDGSGNYSIPSLAAGSYKVVFFGSNASSKPYVQKWYNNGADLASATPVVVGSATSSGINAVMNQVAQPKIDLASVTNVAPGTTVKIPVTLTTNGAAISSAGVTLTFDPAKITRITYIDPATGTKSLGAATTAASKGASQNNATAGKYTLGVLAIDNTNMIGDGVLVNLFADIAADATGPITITSEPSASDPSANDVAVTGASSNLTFPDLTAPTVTGFTANNSTSATVNIPTFTAADNSGGTGVAGYLVTESGDTKPAASAAWSTTAPTSYTFTGTIAQGVPVSKTLYAWAKDAAGNVSNYASATVTLTLLDNTKPEIATFDVPQTSPSATVSISSFTATDNVAVTGYMVTDSSSVPYASNSTWSATAPASYTVPGTFVPGVPTVKTLYAWAKDAAGNVSNVSAARSVTITAPDTTPPTVNSFLTSATSKSKTIIVTSYGATDNGQVAGYKITESSDVPASNASGWSSTVIGTYTITAAITQGTPTDVVLYAWAKDAAGNVSAAKTATVTVTLDDLTAPVVSDFTIPASSTSLVIPVSTLVATDNVAVTAYLVNESASTPSANAAGWSSAAPASYTVQSATPKGVATNRTLYAWAKDAAGNVSISKSATVKITLSGPTITFAAGTLPDGTATKNPALNMAGTADGKGIAIQSLTITDNALAPVNVTVGSNGAFSTAIVLVNGDNRLTTTATDANGLTVSDVRTINYNPALPDLVISQPGNGSFTKNNYVDVKGTVGAPQSTTLKLALNSDAATTLPLDGDSFSTTLNLVPGENKLVFTATDISTSPETVHTQVWTVVSDGTAPTLSVSAPSDAVVTPKSTIVVSGSVADSVTKPTVTVKVGSADPVAVTVTDGAFILPVSLPAVSADFFPVVVTATDEAGNTATVTRNVRRTYPSGNAADGVNKPEIEDALKVMQYVLGLGELTADQKVYTDVAPLGADGKPNPDGKVDGGDILIILEKVVGKVTW